MHIVVIFYNIGGYHAARLREASLACQQKGWNLTAIEVTDNTSDRPWGDVKNLTTFPLKTLLPIGTTPKSVDRGPFSQVAASSITSCLANLKPNFVAIPGWGFPVSRAALSWCRKNKISTILMSESKWDDEPRQWWKELLKSWLYIKKYNAALVGSESHKSYLIKLGLASRKIFFGYDVVDNNYFDQTASRAKHNPDDARKRQLNIPVKPYFLAATRFIKRKNVVRLIEAFAAYCQEINQEEAWDLVICGSGPEESKIRQVIQDNHLENKIHLPGFIPYDSLGDWYGLANAFIHPALQEQWGLVVNEAMAAGLPVIVSNRCGCFEELIIERVNGFGFDPENSQQLTNLMLTVSSPNCDREKIGKAALQHIQNFAPERFAHGLVEAVEYVVTH